MLQKSARIALALVLSLSLCPAAAFAVGEDAGLDGGYAATQASEVPVIDSIDADAGSTTIEVKGSNFGAEQGTGSVAVATGGIASGGAIPSAVSSWSDTRIEIDVDEELSGVIDVEVKTSAGTASKEYYVDAGPDVYEKSFKNKPSDEFATDYTGALSSSSIIKGWGEYLYFLRETPAYDGSTDFALQTFERYSLETKEWDDSLPDLPERLRYASGCIWNDNLLVAGVGEDGTEKVYQYNFTDGDPWGDPVNSDGVPLGAGIVNLNGYLKVVGGAESDWSFVDSVYDYDTDSGAGDLYATLETPVFCPSLAVNESQIFVYSYGDSLAEYNSTSAIAERHLQVVVADGDEAVELSGVFPEFANVDVPEGMPARSEAFGSIAAAIEGLMLVGPSSAQDATDTYILDWDWEGAQLYPYYQHASDARMYGASACIHDNFLYAIAASELESEHCVFRATEMAPPLVESISPSDEPWKKGSSSGVIIRYTPDYSRFVNVDPDRSVVIVTGKGRTDELILNDEYTASPGSTVVELLPDYLNELAAGTYQVTAYFDGYEDGPGAEVVASFTIEDPSNPIINPDNPGGGGGNGVGGGSASGYTRPAALAMTGDLMLVVPFVILGVGAVALGIYLVRRRIRNNN